MVIAPHETNRQHWDEVTPVHVGSRFYDVDAFLAGRCTVGPVERAAVATCAASGCCTSSVTSASTR